MATKTQPKTEQPKAPEMRLLKKISVSTVCGKIEDKTERALLHVYGVTHGVKQGQSDYGPWISFVGNFAAVNLETGEEFRAGKLFLPEIAEIMLHSQLAEADSVQFAFEIGIIESKKSAIGYEYTVKPLVKPQENDPLLAMKKQLLLAGGTEE